MGEVAHSINQSRLPSPARAIVLSLAVAQGGFAIAAGSSAPWYYAGTAGAMLLLALVAILYVTRPRG